MMELLGEPREISETNQNRQTISELPKVIEEEDEIDEVENNVG